jgi:hypothetical protein
MYGGVRVTKQNNIFNLIRNPQATVDDLKKLIELAAEKLNDNEYGKNPLELAIELGKNTMADFLRTKGLKEKNPIVNNIIKNMKENKSVEELRDLIKDENLELLLDDDKRNIINIILKNFDGIYVDQIRLKLNELVKKKFNNILSEDFSASILIKIHDRHLDFFKFFVEKAAKSKILTYKFPLLAFFIKYSSNNVPEKIELLIQNGADINVIFDTDDAKMNLLGFIYMHVNDDILMYKLYKILIEAGLDPDAHTDTLLPILFIAIHKQNKKLFDFFIENGADVNKVVRDNSPLHIACNTYSSRYYISTPKIYYVEKLVEKGADVNKLVYNITPLYLICEHIQNKEYVNIVKYLLENGATKDIHTIKYAEERYASETNNELKELYKEVLKLLGVDVKDKMWKGSTRADIEKYDIFFTEPDEYSCCPICLRFVERREGCMYMTHDCATSPFYYHKKLYDTYVYKKHETAVPQIEWCTICGRPSKLHKHYELSLVNNLSKNFGPISPEIQARLEAGQNIVFFDNANCIGFGGGGLDEKAVRFRRLREYALELEDDVGKKTHNEAMNELIEEVFNAPQIRKNSRSKSMNEKLKKISNNKKWNINTSLFPTNYKLKNNKKEYVEPPFTGTLPTVLNPVENKCIIMTDDDEEEETNPTLQFHHTSTGGISHDGIYICKNGLKVAIEYALNEFGGERFGKCWFNTCLGTLHPEEIKPHVPEALYNRYKELFNKKMANAANAANAQGGSRNKTNTRNTRKTKNTRKTNKTNKTNTRNKTKSLNDDNVLHELDLDTAICLPPNFNRDGSLKKRV